MPATGSVPGQYQMVAYAGFWIRFVAWLIDWIIQFIASIILGVAFGIGLAIAEAPLGSDSSSAQLLTSLTNLFVDVLVLALAWLYFSLLQSSRYQASLGMMAVGLSVVGYDGSAISFGRATGRFFASLLSWVICWIGYFMIAFTARKQGLHDIIASTYVVRSRPSPGVRLYGGSPVTALGTGERTAAAIAAGAAAVAIVILTSIVVVVILLTMGNQIKNVFSNVVVALGAG